MHNETNPNWLSDMGKKVSVSLPPNDTYDRLMALELGGVALTSICAINTEKPFLLMRRKSKEYGTKQMIEGTIKKHERIVWIKDSIPTTEEVLHIQALCDAHQLTLIGCWVTSSNPKNHTNILNMPLHFV